MNHLQKAFYATNYFEIRHETKAVNGESSLCLHLSADGDCRNLLCDLAATTKKNGIVAGNQMVLSFEDLRGLAEALEVACLDSKPVTGDKGGFSYLIKQQWKDFPTNDLYVSTHFRDGGMTIRFDMGEMTANYQPFAVEIAKEDATMFIAAARLILNAMSRCAENDKEIE